MGYVFLFSTQEVLVLKRTNGSSFILRARDAGESSSEHEADAHVQADEELQVLSQQVKELCSETIWLARTTQCLITSADAGGWDEVGA